MNYIVPALAIALLTYLAFLIYKDLKKRHKKRDFY